MLGPFCALLCLSVTLAAPFLIGDHIRGGPIDCTDVLATDLEAESGPYTVYVGDRRTPANVYCDMETWRGGWTTLLHRFNGSVSFNRAWKEMKQPIGSLTSEHWLGLDTIHKMTSAAPFVGGRYQLLVQLEGDSNTQFAFYDNFWIEDEPDKYRLHVSGYHAGSSAGDSLTVHNAMPFTTYDQDNDQSGDNCAVEYEGPWWHKACHASNLLAPYRYSKGNRGVIGTFADSMCWQSFDAKSGYHYTLKGVTMKIRRVSK